MQSYLDSLDEEISKQPGFKKPPRRIVKKRRTTSQTDSDSGYINHGSKRGVGYLIPCQRKGKPVGSAASGTAKETGWSHEPSCAGPWI